MFCKYLEHTLVSVKVSIVNILTLALARAKLLHIPLLCL